MKSEKRYPTRSVLLNGRMTEPVVFGSVCAHFVKRGGKTFGPYWFLFYRWEGKLRKRYIPRELVDDVRGDCELARRDRKESATRKREGLAEFSELKRTLALIEKLSRGDPEQCATSNEVWRITNGTR